MLADSWLKDDVAGGRVLVRDRKPEICGDFVSMNLVLADDIANVPSAHDLMTHTTNPQLASHTIQQMLKTCMAANAAGEADSLFTVNERHARFYTAAGAPMNHDPHRLIPTQDLPACFEENSVCDLFTPERFAKAGARIGKTPMLFPTPRLQFVDIDDPADWFMAESLLMRVVAGDTLPEG